MPEVTDLSTSQHILLIGKVVHHGVLNIHCCSPADVIPVSAKMWLVLAAGSPPLSGTTVEENNVYPQ